MASLWRRIGAQLNMGDKGATFKNPTPGPQAQAAPRIDADALIRALQQQARTANPQQRRAIGAQINAVATGSNLPGWQQSIAPNGLVAKVGQKGFNVLTNRTVGPISTGIARSGGGTLQGISGLYDLASPGKGNNRYTKALERQNVALDQANKIQAYSSPVYRGAQVATDAASFLVGGKPFTAGAEYGAAGLSKIPGAGKIVRGVEVLGEHGPGGKVLASGIKYLARPDVASNIASDVVLGAGNRAAKGADVSGKTFAQDAAMSAGTALTLGAAGYGVRRAGAPAVDFLRNQHVIKPARLNPREVAVLEAFQQQRGSGAITDNDLYQRARAIAGKAKLSLNDSEGIDNLLGDFRTYNTRQQQIKSRLPIGNATLAVDEAGNPVAIGDILKGRMQSTPGSLPTAPQESVAATPGTKPSRFPNVTAQNTDELSNPLKGLIKDENIRYDTTTDKGRLEQAKALLEGKNEEQMYTGVMQQLDKMQKTSNGQEFVTAIEAIKRLDSLGTEDAHFKATEIMHRIGEKAPKLGQQIQALSALSSRTPQGLLYQATKTLDDAGAKLTPQKGEMLKKLIDDVKNAQPGSYEDGLARYKVMEFVNKESPSKFSGKIMQIWKAGLLTSPTTTTGNILANSAEQIYKHGYKDPVAAGVDNLMSIITGKRSKSLTYRGIASGTKEGALKGVSYFKTGYDPRQPLTKFNVNEIHYSDTAAGKAAEKYTQAVFRLMGSQDQPFFYASMRNSLADQAVTEAKNQGLKGGARADFIKRFVTQPSKDAIKLADQEARYDVFQNETLLGRTAGSINKGPIGQFVVPFSQVPSSVATRMIDRTPLGLAKEIISQVRTGKFDQRAMANAIADSSAGVVLLGAGAALAKAGELTLGFPTDQKERDLWEREGKQPNAVKIGGTWVSLNYIQPLGNILAAGANFQAAKKGGQTTPQAAAAGAAGAGKALTDQSFLKGVSGVTQALSDPLNAGEKFAEQTAGSVVPGLVRNIARSTDPKLRVQSGVTAAVQAGIPGARQNLPVKTDIFGQEVPRKTDMLNSTFNPLRPSDSRPSDAITSELRRLQTVDEGTTASKIVSNSLGKELPKLSGPQQLELKNKIGQQLHTAWTEAIQNPKYQKLNDGDKKRTLDKIRDDLTGALKAQYSADLGNAPDPKKLSLNEKRILQGKTVDYFSKLGKKATAQESYDEALRKYREDQGDMTEIQRQKAQYSLVDLKVKTGFSSDITDLYGFNKDRAYDYLSSHSNGKKLAEQLIAYGDAREKAGLGKNKFRNSNGAVSIQPSKKGGGTRKLPSVKVAQLRSFKVSGVRTGKAKRKGYKIPGTGTQKKISLKA